MSRKQLVKVLTSETAIEFYKYVACWGLLVMGMIVLVIITKTVRAEMHLT